MNSKDSISHSCTSSLHRTLLDHLETREQRTAHDWRVISALPIYRSFLFSAMVESLVHDVEVNCAADSERWVRINFETRFDSH